MLLWGTRSERSSFWREVSENLVIRWDKWPQGYSANLCLSHFKITDAVWGFKQLVPSLATAVVGNFSIFLMNRAFWRVKNALWHSLTWISPVWGAGTILAGLQGARDSRETFQLSLVDVVDPVDVEEALAQRRTSALYDISCTSSSPRKYGAYAVVVFD